MNSKRDGKAFVWPGNDAILQRRYGVKPRSDNVRVRLGLYAFIKAWVVTFGVWFIISLLVALVDSLTSPYSIALSIWAGTLFFSFFIAVLIGTPIAMVLESALRPVRQQWIHVLVFGGSFAVLTFVITWLLISGPFWGLPSGLAIVVGGATAIGRASVRGNAELYNSPHPAYIPTHLQE